MLITKTRDPAGGVATADVGEQLLLEYSGDLRFLLVAGENAVIEMMHPGFESVVAGYSQFFADVWRRWFERTQHLVQGTVYDRDPTETAHQIRDIHKRLRGIDNQGRTWRALDPDVFHFAHAAQYHMIWRMMDIFCGRPLDEEESEAYYQATRRIWKQYGLREGVAPPDWPSFLEYMDTFCEEQLQNTEGAHKMIEFLAGAPVPPIRGLPEGAWHKVAGPVFESYARISTGLLPAPAREKLGLPAWTAEDEQWLRDVGARVAAAGAKLPRGVLQTPQARKWHARHDRSLGGRIDYLVGEGVQRPIQFAWRVGTT